ncbi:MAG: aminotransferase class V-fold PLP-dependent enzyme [Planctomycetota bacterium]|nr:aminotransferase class V-fold PLP-dependent enzyme [Planctomycetota bacterium]
MPAYLDNNATTRPDPAVVDAVLEALRDQWHNPSSVHRPGQAARHRVELARESVARLLGADPAELVFTSGATESIDLAIRGVLAAAPATRRTIITTPIEHEAVRDLAASLAAEGVTVRALPLLEGGVVDADALDALLDPSVALVSVQWANNETGAIQPVERLARTCRERGVCFHTDATQWVGKMPTDVRAAGVDLLSFSAHKLHGPKGAGALYIRRGVRLRPSLRGTQERERRGGTENVPGIIGMGVASELAMAWLARSDERDRLALLRDRLEHAVLEAVPNARINGPRGANTRLWNTTNIAFPTLEAEALLLLLSERGVCASAGAACSSGSLDPSPVLLAMGVPPALAHGSVRFSLSRHTTEDEIDEAARQVAACVRRLAASGV